MRFRSLAHLVHLALTAAALACSPSPANEPSSSTAPSGAPADREVGLVAWESNRSGAFRIWAAGLDGSNPRQLSADESGRDHCCARISPDGERIAYLSMPVSRHGYLPATASGELRLLQIADGRERTLSTSARHLGLHRSIVWWDPTALAYLEADGSTHKLDLALAATDTLVHGEPGEPGWIVAPGGRHASSQPPSFGERDPSSGRIRLSTPLGGCEPMFSADGELGLWVAGAGGPLDVIDLSTRETRTLLRKNDTRLPEGARYLYFPALSPDRSLLAYGASGGRHDHFRANYEIYIAPLDPETLELAGAPRPIAPHPAVDRYPDVWRLAGERRRSPTAPSFAGQATTTGPLPPVFLWDHATAANRRSAEADSEILTARGATWTDRHGRLALAGGEYVASRATAQRVAMALEATHALSFALLVEPAGLEDRSGPLLALGRSPSDRAFVIRQRGHRLELLLRTGRQGDALPPIPLVELSGAVATHVAVSFSPGRLAVYLDGALVDRRIVAGDFFHWRVDDLLVGAEPGGRERFRGHLSHLRIWDRELDAAEAPALAEAALGHLKSAPTLERREAVSRLLARSRIPTLAEISPYRRALLVEEHELIGSLAGELPPRFRVARWALLDGESTRAAGEPVGGERRLVLEPFAAQPQLEGVVISDTLPTGELPLFFSVTLDEP